MSKADSPNSGKNYRVPRRDASAAKVRAVPSRRRAALLVEDHSPTRAALKLLLSRRGYQVIEAETVREAVNNAARTNLDLMLSDLSLPDGSGYDVVRQVLVGQPDLPAIALSGSGMDADIKKALAAGFSAHLTKPVGIEQLDALLDEMEQRTPASAER